MEGVKVSTWKNIYVLQHMGRSFNRILSPRLRLICSWYIFAAWSESCPVRQGQSRPMRSIKAMAFLCAASRKSESWALRKCIQGRINFTDEQIHTLPFIVFSFSESLFLLRIVLLVLQYLFLDCEKDNKRAGNTFFVKLLLLCKGKKKVRTSSWFVGRWMRESVLSKGSSFLLLVVLEDGSSTPEVVEVKI